MAYPLSHLLIRGRVFCLDLLDKFGCSGVLLGGVFNHFSHIMRTLNFYATFDQKPFFIYSDEYIISMLPVVLKRLDLEAFENVLLGRRSPRGERGLKGLSVLRF